MNTSNTDFSDLTSTWRSSDLPGLDVTQARWVKAFFFGSWHTMYCRGVTPDGDYWCELSDDSPMRRFSPEHVKELQAKT